MTRKDVYGIIATVAVSLVLLASGDVHFDIKTVVALIGMRLASFAGAAAADDLICYHIRRNKRKRAHRPGRR